MESPADKSCYYNQVNEVGSLQLSSIEYVNDALTIKLFSKIDGGFTNLCLNDFLKNEVIRYLDHEDIIRIFNFLLKPKRTRFSILSYIGMQDIFKQKVIIRDNEKETVETRNIREAISDAKLCFGLNGRDAYYLGRVAGEISVMDDHISKVLGPGAHKYDY